MVGFHVMVLNISMHLEPQNQPELTLIAKISSQLVLAGLSYTIWNPSAR
jgi:hypothetical protein